MSAWSTFFVNAGDLRIHLAQASQERLRARMGLHARVFASLDGVTPGALRTLSVGLSFSPEPLRGLSRPFEGWAEAVERRTEDPFIPDTPNLILRAAIAAVGHVGRGARGGPEA